MLNVIRHLLNVVNLLLHSHFTVSVCSLLQFFPYLTQNLILSLTKVIFKVSEDDIYLVKILRVQIHTVYRLLFRFRPLLYKSDLLETLTLFQAVDGLLHFEQRVATLLGEEFVGGGGRRGLEDVGDGLVEDLGLGFGSGH